MSPRTTLSVSPAAPGQISLQIPSLESATAHAQRTRNIRKGVVLRNWKESKLEDYLKTGNDSRYGGASLHHGKVFVEW